MKRHGIRWVIVFLLILSLSSMACQLFGGDEDPTPDSAGASETAAEPEAVEPIESENSAAAGSADSSSESQPSDDSSQQSDGAAPADFELSALSRELDFDSYRFALEMQFSGTDASGNEFVQDISADIAFVAQPLAMAISMSMEGVPGTNEFDQIAMAQIGETTYMVMPGVGCITSAAVEGGLIEDNPFADFLDPSQLIDDLQGAKYAGREEVNGIQTLVYEFDESFLKNEDEMEWADGKIYVAADGNYLVRMIMDGEGAMDVFNAGSTQTGLVHMAFNLTDVNQPVEIGIPEECDNAAGSGDLPMLEDAFEISTFAGFLNYKSNATIEDGVAFYEDVLGEDGWLKNEDESFMMEGTAMLSYNREGESLTLTLGDDNESGGIFIMLMTEDAQ